MNCRTYSLTSTPNDRFLENCFISGLFILRVFTSNLLKKSSNKYFFFIFRCLTRGTNWGFSSNKSTHILLDYGDFIRDYLLSLNHMATITHIIMFTVLIGHCPVEKQHTTQGLSNPSSIAAWIFLFFFFCKLKLYCYQNEMYCYQKSVRRIWK